MPYKDLKKAKEYRNAYNKKYREENRDKLLKNKRDYYKKPEIKKREVIRNRLRREALKRRKELEQIITEDKKILILTLCYATGITVPQISAMFGVPPTSVKRVLKVGFRCFPTLRRSRELYSVMRPSKKTPLLRFVGTSEDLKMVEQMEYRKQTGRKPRR